MCTYIARYKDLIIQIVLMFGYFFQKPTLAWLEFTARPVAYMKARFWKTWNSEN